MDTTAQAATEIEQATVWPPEASPKPIPTQQIFLIAAIIAAPAWVLWALSAFTSNDALRYVGGGFLALAVLVGIALMIVHSVVNVREANRTRQELAKNPRFAKLAEGLKAQQQPQPLIRPLARSLPMLIIGGLALIALLITVFSGVLH